MNEEPNSSEESQRKDSQDEESFRSKKDKVNLKLSYFNAEMEVYASSSQSSQAVVFFGRELQLGLRTVVKQYTDKKRKSAATEIKIFTQLEKLRNLTSGRELDKVVKSGDLLPGFPVMLAYKVGAYHSEIMMTYGGDSINKWMHRITNLQRRIDYAADLLR